MRGPGPRRGLKPRGLLGLGAVFAGRVRVLPAWGGRERGVASLSVLWEKKIKKEKAFSFASEALLLNLLTPRLLRIIP